MPGEVRALIREISIANPLWGAPWIHGELLKLAIEVLQSMVANYKDTLLGRPVQYRGRITPMPELGGLHRACIRT